MVEDETGLEEEEIEEDNYKENVNSTTKVDQEDQTKWESEEVDPEREEEMNYCASLRDQLILCTRQLTAPYVTLVAIRACNDVADRFGVCRSKINEKYGILLNIDPKYFEGLDKQ